MKLVGICYPADMYTAIYTCYKCVGIAYDHTLLSWCTIRTRSARVVIGAVNGEGRGEEVSKCVNDCAVYRQ